MAVTTETRGRPVSLKASLRRLQHIVGTSSGSTPGLLRTIRAVVVVLCLSGGAVGLLGVQARVNATAEIQKRTGPLSSDVIGLYRSLAAADATVAGEFLLPPGGDPTEVRKTYSDHLDQAARNLTHASSLVDEQGLTASRLASISSQLPVYAGLVEKARALPAPDDKEVALRDASSLMQSDILRRAEALQRSESRNLDLQYRSARSVPVLGAVVCLLGLLSLIAAQLLLLRRTRRVFNVGLAAASALVVGALLWATVGLSVSQDNLASSGRHIQSVTDALGLAQIAALQARSDEMLGLVGDSDVRSYENGFLAKTQLLARNDGEGGVGGALGAARRYATDPQSQSAADTALELTRSWQQTHTEVDALRQSGLRSRAIESATGVNPAGAGRAFELLNTSLAEAVRDEDAAFRGDIRQAHAALGGLAAGTVLLSLAAAAAAIRGIGQRLKEYT